MQSKGADEIAINQPGELFVKRFTGWERFDVPELDLEHCKALSLAIATFNGQAERALNSVVLPAGERGQINRPPATLSGVLSFNIRIPSAVVKSLEQLAEEGCFAAVRDVSLNKITHEEAVAKMNATDFSRLEDWEVELLRLKREGRWVEFLTMAIRSKRNIIIAGGTGSGKTTFGRSIIEKVPFDERIVTIEDVHELFLPNHINRVALLFGEGSGRVPAKSCLKAAMRMTPDRIFPAELRGDEAWEYLMSLNTGHPGSLTTLHANSGVETFGRLFSLIKSSEVGRELDSDFIKDEIYKTVHITLYFEARQLKEIFYDPLFTKSKLF
jgi:type IV secretion system protein VirB11